MRYTPAVRTVLRPRLGRKRAKMIALMHVRLEDPRFGQPSRDWLRNEEVGTVVRRIVERELPKHFEQVPALLDSILLACEPKARPRARRSSRSSRPESRR